MKIAILTRPDYRSPRILAESLKFQIEKLEHTADIFFNIDTLTRLKSYSETNKSFSYHFWIWRKLRNYIKDQKIIRTLKLYDTIIISECTPNGFWKEFYHVEKFRKIINKPILYHEVYYLGNTPTQIEKLFNNGDPSIERYDFHLAVTDVTEIRTSPNQYWSYIGLDMTNWNLTYEQKDEFIALVDFAQEGYEKFQDEQIKVLEQLNIKYIVLKDRYTIDEIREIYKKSSILFLQFPEAFGMPIAECLACGVQVFTPNSGWPMSWRLDEDPEVHGSGILPECFTIYQSTQDLKDKVLAFKNVYNIKKTPKVIFDNFILNYPHLYYGNKKGVEKLIQAISKHK